jgi:hypothetical protein
MKKIVLIFLLNTLLPVMAFDRDERDIISIYEKDPFYAVETSLVGIVFGFLLSMIVGVATAQPGEPETYCQVTIDDSVSFNEFQQKYEIIEQEGQIYTVKAKTIE